MATWRMDRDGTWDYPGLGFRATSGDILIANSAPDAFWTSIADGPAETVNRYKDLTQGGGTNYVETADGYILAYSQAQNTYIPTDPAQLSTLSAAYAAFGTDFNTFLSHLPSGALYNYTLLDSSGVLIDIYTGKKA